MLIRVPTRLKQDRIPATNGQMGAVGKPYTRWLIGTQVRQIQQVGFMNAAEVSRTQQRFYRLHGLQHHSRLLVPVNLGKIALTRYVSDAPQVDMAV